jgi:methylthioribose-1-phosphate isomerase
MGAEGHAGPQGVKTIEWRDGAVFMIDQRLLPQAEEYVCCRSWEEVAAAIKDMVVRGAPAIGVAAAMGIALAAGAARGFPQDRFRSALQGATEGLFSTRPTAVNLKWALDEMERLWSRADVSPGEIAALIEARAVAMLEEDLEACRNIGRNGAELIDGDAPVVLTHCNAGALATAGYGTALGVIRAAHRRNPRLRVLADETRPLLQGARLTAWELCRDGIPVELITDSMAGYFLASGEVTHVVVGADRIAANGDTANKIGTYSVAVLAHENGVPFFVAAPVSTVDLSLPDGGHIPIEERSETEVTSFAGACVAPTGVRARNPAFDVTPARYISAIITDRGVARAPFSESLRGVTGVVDPQGGSSGGVKPCGTGGSREAAGRRSREP